MAYFTYVPTPRELTEAEQAQIVSYVEAQITAGTTNGERYVWTTMMTPVLGASEAPAASRSVRMWGTVESATGYQAVFAGFSPTVTVAMY